MAIGLLGRPTRGRVAPETFGIGPGQRSHSDGHPGRSAWHARARNASRWNGAGSPEASSTFSASAAPALASRAIRVGAAQHARHRSRSRTGQTGPVYRSSLRNAHRRETDVLRPPHLDRPDRWLRATAPAQIRLLTADSPPLTTHGKWRTLPCQARLHDRRQAATALHGRIMDMQREMPRRPVRLRAGAPPGRPAPELKRGLSQVRLAG